jgi:hypothetical protein
MHCYDLYIFAFCITRVKRKGQKKSFDIGGLGYLDILGIWIQQNYCVAIVSYYSIKMGGWY